MSLPGIALRVIVQGSFDRPKVEMVRESGTRIEQNVFQNTHVAEPDIGRGLKPQLFSLHDLLG